MMALMSRYRHAMGVVDHDMGPPQFHRCHRGQQFVPGGAVAKVDVRVATQDLVRVQRDNLVRTGEVDPTALVITGVDRAGRCIGANCSATSERRSAASA